MVFVLLLVEARVMLHFQTQKRTASTKTLAIAFSKTFKSSQLFVYSISSAYFLTSQDSCGHNGARNGTHSTR